MIEFIIVSTQENRIVLSKYLGSTKQSIVYLLAYSSLDTEEQLSIDGFTSNMYTIESGHKIVIINSLVVLNEIENMKASISNLIWEDMLNPFIDCNSCVSKEFENSFIK